MKTFRSKVVRFGQKENGAILILALILLTIMSIVGISANRDVVLQERMTGNELDNLVALQSAEAALRAAEQELGVTCAPDDYDFGGAQNGKYDFMNNEAEDWELMIDESEGSDLWLTLELDQTVRNPRYYIEFIASDNIDSDNNLDSTSEYKGYKLYRVTAQGYGTSEKTNSVVRAIYYMYEC